jgi:hypothetical protein
MSQQPCGKNEMSRAAGSCRALTAAYPIDTPVGAGANLCDKVREREMKRRHRRWRGRGGGDENCAVEGLKARFGEHVTLPVYPAAAGGSRRD